MQEFPISTFEIFSEADFPLVLPADGAGEFWKWLRFDIDTATNEDTLRDSFFFDTFLFVSDDVERVEFSNAESIAILS